MGGLYRGSRDLFGSGRESKLSFVGACLRSRVRLASATEGRNRLQGKGKMTRLEEFAGRVREAREALPATIEEVALFSGLTPERVATIETGKDKSVNALEIQRLAFALGTTYQALMFGKVSA